MCIITPPLLTAFRYVYEYPSLPLPSSLLLQICAHFILPSPAPPHPTFRYVQYYEQLLRSDFEALLHPCRTLHSVALSGPSLPPSTRLLLSLQEHGGPPTQPPTTLALTLPPCRSLPLLAQCEVVIERDVRVDISDGRGVLARVWMHPALEPAEVICEIANTLEHLIKLACISTYNLLKLACSANLLVSLH